jgi:hypothetical protein
MDYDQIEFYRQLKADHKKAAAKKRLLKLTIIIGVICLSTIIL